MTEDRGLAYDWIAPLLALSHKPVDADYRDELTQPHGRKKAKRRAHRNLHKLTVRRGRHIIDTTRKAGEAARPHLHGTAQ